LKLAYFENANWLCEWIDTGEALTWNTFAEVYEQHNSEQYEDDHQVNEDKMPTSKFKVYLFKFMYHTI
jgi:hypothetical protein